MIQESTVIKKITMEIKTPQDIKRGMVCGFIGVACFSMTAPMTRLALVGFTPYFVTIGRVALAGILAALLLYSQKAVWPAQAYRKKLILVSLGVCIGFPLCLSLALTQTGASHAGIVLAILPLLTSIIGARINGEKHSTAFWLIAVSGCLTVLAYIFWKNGIILTHADGWLLLAALSAATAYSMGGNLAKHLGGLHTICWAVVFALPISIPTALYLLPSADTFVAAPVSAISALLYLAVVSQFLGFVPWYAGLSRGGVARVSQVQLLQPFLTLFAAALFLGETVGWHEWAVAFLVVGQIYLLKKSA